MGTAKLTLSLHRIRETQERELVSQEGPATFDTAVGRTLSLPNASLQAPGVYAITAKVEPVKDPQATPGGRPAQFTTEMVAEVRRAAKNSLSTDDTKKRHNDLQHIADIMESHLSRG